MPDSTPAHVCSVPAAQMMSSFRSPVIVLPMIRRRHSSTPTGLMPLSFFLSGTMGVGSSFSRGRPLGNFSKSFRGDKSGKILFFPLETKKVSFFCWKFQNPGGPWPLHPPLWWPWMEQVCMQGKLIYIHVEWCPSQDALPRWQFHQLAFVSECHMISNKSFLSKFPCQSMSVLQTPMSFWYWMRFHLELYFQK